MSFTKAMSSLKIVDGSLNLTPYQESLSQASHWIGQEWVLLAMSPFEDLQRLSVLLDRLGRLLLQPVVLPEVIADIADPRMIRTVGVAKYVEPSHVVGFGFFVSAEHHQGDTEIDVRMTNDRMIFERSL